MDTELLQVRAAALLLGVHENTLRNWEKAGRINAVHLPSGVRRFRAEDVDRLRTQMYRAIGVQDAALEAAVESLPAEAPHAVATAVHA